MFCKRCGSENPEGAKFCRKCGASIVAGSAASNQSEQQTKAEDANQKTYEGRANHRQQYQQDYTAPLQGGRITVDDLPAEYRPIGMWGYFGYSLLFNIPFIGWIIALVFAFGVTSNVNLKNYARGYFCGLIVLLVIMFLLSLGGCSLLSALS